MVKQGALVLLTNFLNIDFCVPDFAVFAMVELYLFTMIQSQGLHSTSSQRALPSLWLLQGSMGAKCLVVVVAVACMLTHDIQEPHG